MGDINDIVRRLLWSRTYYGMCQRRELSTEDKRRLLALESALVALLELEHEIPLPETRTLARMLEEKLLRILGKYKSKPSKTSNEETGVQENG